MDDHDTLIKLQGQVENLTAVVTANATHSTERDARIEAGVDRINGSVDAQDVRLLKIEIAREQEAAEVERTQKNREVIFLQHAEMWTAFRVGRWLIVTLMTVSIAQGAALIALILGRGIGG